MSRPTADADIPREVDEWGRVWFDGGHAVELLLRGHDPASLLMRPTPETEAYNEWCAKFDKAAHRIDPPAEADLAAAAGRRVNTWWIDPPFRDLPVRETLLARCANPRQRLRVQAEMDLFEERGLLPVLRLMFMLVDHFRRNDVVWGVGRGSSVASYVLFLIGVHRIDSLAEGLDIAEFLR